MTITLALDTSVKNVSLALFQNGELKSFRHEVPQNTQSLMIIKIIDDELKKTGITLGDISEVIFCHGPGSFTSLRVGLATLKGLFVGTATKLKVASSLLLRCLSLPEAVGSRVALIKMGRDRVVAGFLRSGEFYQKLFSISDFNQEIIAIDGGHRLSDGEVITEHGFCELMNSRFLKVDSWDVARPHYLMAPDIG